MTGSRRLSEAALWRYGVQACRMQSIMVLNATSLLSEASQGPFRRPGLPGSCLGAPTDALRAWIARGIGRRTLTEVRLPVGDLSSHDYTSVENSRHAKLDWPVFDLQKALIETS